jgi:diadenosine tetraphosphate (Ap4A) HIT family hydrolase
MNRRKCRQFGPGRHPWLAIRQTARKKTWMLGTKPGMNGCCDTLCNADEIVRDPDMPSAIDWSLHSQLQKDTIDIGDLPLCRVLVIKDAHYPWLLLVPRRAEVVEIIDLDEVEQAQLMTEISRVARALKEITKCDKLNIAALGNVVPQLHVHVIARRSSDVAWPRPVWGVMPPLEHDAEEVQNFISALRRKIWLG